MGVARAHAKPAKKALLLLEKKTCLTSLLLGNRAGVNGHVERALVGRDLSGNRSSGHDNKDGGGSHLERR